jgi:hypothetical protein
MPFSGSGEMLGAMNVPKGDANFWPPDRISSAAPL